MKKFNHDDLHAIIKRAVMIIENKTQLAKYLQISPPQVFRWVSEWNNRRHIPECYWTNILMYMTIDTESKRSVLLKYKKIFKSFAVVKGEVESW